jgi:hypothetical protein
MLRVHFFCVARSMAMICLASLGVSWALNLMYGVIPRTHRTGWIATLKWRVIFNCHLPSLIDPKPCGLLTTPLQSHSGSVCILLVRICHSWRKDSLLQNKVFVLCRFILGFVLVCGGNLPRLQIRRSPVIGIWWFLSHSQRVVDPV